MQFEMRKGAVLVACAFLAIPATWSSAGPDHIEGPDAGSTSGSAQPVFKSPSDPSLKTISGGLLLVRGPADLEDMYLFKIVDPVGFSASTDPNDGGLTAFDSQLWLFQITPTGEAFGILANDESGTGPGTAGASKITSQATDGTGQMIPGPGVYALAISALGNDPLSALGPIFNIVDRTEISGPDGPGGMAPHQAWTGGGDAAPGEYLIRLTGAEGFVITQFHGRMDTEQAIETAQDGATGSGSTCFSFEDFGNTLSFDIRYKGIHDPETASHIHGPSAGPGTNAPVLYTLPLGSNKTGTIQLMELPGPYTVDQQKADLLAGLWYVNVHSNHSPGGEIRGQILPGGCACCFIPESTCEEAMPADCSSQGGFSSVGKTCEESQSKCPAVSVWGVALLAGCLVGAGGIVVRRRVAAAT